MTEKLRGCLRVCAILSLIAISPNSELTAQEDELSLATIKTVVIDAGHGGKDPGCHGAYAKEKHVCLSMALKLGAKINALYPKINVIYTRNTDVFVELDERAKIANRNKADLFINLNKLPINALNVIGKNNIDNIRGNKIYPKKTVSIFSNIDGFFLFAFIL